MRKGDSSTNIIIFLTIIVAAMILVVWYAQMVRPTRAVMGAVIEDMHELQQHFGNGCAVTTYRATYLMATETGFYTGNATHYCIYTEVYGSCREYPYQGCVEPQRVELSEDTLIFLEKNSSTLILHR